MPTYEYACKSCGEHLEVVQSFKDDPLTECPSCGGALRKVFGSIGIAFKGSGFYRTDSRPAAKEAREAKAGSDTKAGSDAKGDAKAGGEDKHKAESKAESKADSKAESKAESKAAASS